MAHLLTSALVALLAATLIAWFAAVLHERGLHPLRRLLRGVSPKTPFQAAILAAVAIGMIHHGGTKTNGVPNRAGGAALRGGALTEHALAASTNEDWLAFGAHEDWFRTSTEGWCFRFGTGLVENVTVLACGEIRAWTRDASNLISVLGMPLSLLPKARWDAIGGAESLFWHAETPSNTLLLAWVNALAGRDTNAPVSVFVELSRDGAATLRYDFSAVADMSALTNAAALVRRDGTDERVPLANGAVAAVDFAAPPATGTNALDEVYARMAGGDSNAYYFVDAVVGRGPARIRVRAAGGSTLGGYEVMAEPGATNRLPLLIGERYEVSGETAFEHFALEESEMRTEESFPTATNLTDRLVAVEWPLKFALEEVAAGAEAVAYVVRVTPDGLGGEFVWGGAANGNMRGAARGCAACGTPPMRSGGGCICGCISAESNLVTHASSCECDDCELEGCYLYEGRTECFELPFDDGSDPTGDGGDGEDGGEPDDPPDPPSVSLAFEDSVVIFEDAYENSPGVTVPRQSTRTKLTLTAHGGDDGCTITLDVSDKLQRVPGSSSPPSSVSPGEDIEWSAYYEGASASAQMNDATANATYTNSRTGETGDTGNIPATVVEVKASPNTIAPNDNSPNRHKFGVYEIVSCHQIPATPQVEWNANSGQFYNEGNFLYYRCPLYPDTVTIETSIGDITHNINLSVISPQGIEARNINSIEYGTHSGLAGYVGMRFALYAMPYDVSFEEISIEEVPCAQGTHLGYFAQPSFSNIWYHSRGNGAGNWNKVKFGNKCGDDEAAYTTSIPKVYLLGLDGEPLLGWYYGYLSWDVPFGWNIGGTKGTTPEYRQFATDTRQEITLDAEGTVTVSKLGCWISRSTNDVIMLYGDVP